MTKSINLVKLRAHRILDAAAELVLRWGYDKTTVDDVARQGPLVGDRRGPPGPVVRRPAGHLL